MTETTYLPNDLKQLYSWACFDHNKRLISSISGFYIQAKDYESLTTYQECFDYGLKHPSSILGLALVLPDNYICIDLDANDTELCSEWINGLPTYAEYSINKESIHIFLRNDFNYDKKINLSRGIKIYTKGQYICITGDTLNKNTNIIASNLKSDFERLYNKYFLNNSTDTTSYIISKTNSDEELTEDIVFNRIALSLASNKFYQISQGLYLQADFEDINSAVLAMLHILVFASGANQNIVYKIFKNSKIDDGTFITDSGDTSKLDKFYKQALKDQPIVFEKGKNIKLDYTFDRDTCTFTSFKLYSLDDTGNARRIYERFIDRLKYEPVEKRFYIYNKDLGIWIKDTIEHINVKKLVNIVLDEMKVELQSPMVQQDDNLSKEYLRNVKHLSSSMGKDTAIKELKALETINCSVSDFDKDIFLLNTLDGVLNLKNGTLVKHNPNFYMTKSTRCHVDFKNEPKRFMKFMREICCDDPLLYDYYRRCIGYSLTGSTREQCYWAMFGDGNNGKSVWQNVMSAVFGDYAKTISINTFALDKFANGSKATPDIAKMRGARLILTSEPRENTILNETLIKDITGGTPMTARELYGDFFTFYPQCKIWIACNNMLRITGTTWGDWRRVKKLDLNYVVPANKVDKELTEKLLEEVPSILGVYALSGCKDWQEDGLKEPKSVTDSVSEFRMESNSVLNFATSYTAKASQYTIIGVSDLFTAYMKWARTVGEHTDISQQRFGKEIKSAFSMLYPDVKKVRGKGGRSSFMGVQLVKALDGQLTTDDIQEETYIIEGED